MKTLSFCLLALFLTAVSMGQTSTYQVDGKSAELRTEVEGPLSLRWNTFGKEYRFFAEKDGNLFELVNTKGSDGYLEEYIATLENLTADQNLSADNVRLTLGDLRTFFNSYNTAINPEFVAKKFFSEPEYRLGAFSGITNNVYVTNPDNSSSLQFGAEFEVLDPEQLPRHAAVFQIEHALSSADFEYSATQVSLNYRFKFVKFDKIDVFVNSKLVTFTSFNRDRPEFTVEEDLVFTVEGDSGSAFQAPLLFGLGADIKLGKGYLTLAYNDAFGIFIDNNGEFPVDVSLGYKFVL